MLLDAATGDPVFTALAAAMPVLAAYECAYHHMLIHEGWRLHGDPNETVRFNRPDGTRLDLTSEPRGRPPTRGP